jgi:hypothetical protein
MKRLVLVCEGPTEQEFVKDVMNPHFIPKDIYIQSPLIKKSGGGIVPWSALKNQLDLHLRESDVFVTTLIDYYGIPDRFDYPGWEAAKLIIDPAARMDFLEEQMLLSFDDAVKHRFIPYYQLHEFEGLLFNNLASFDATFAPNEFNDRTELESILDRYRNPELINNDPTTAPSKRLERLIKGYNKIVYGAILAQNIGMVNLRKKSPRFNTWIQKLEKI